jgi:hypothetical protein
VFSLEVTAEPPDATITVDGTAAAAARGARILYLAPGAHQVNVSAPGRVDARLTVAGDAGQSLVRSVALATSPPAAGSPPPAVPERPLLAPAAAHPGIPAHWFVLGASAALLASAAVTGVLAWKADGEFLDACPAARDCPQSARPLEHRATTFALATDVLLGLGLVTGGVGAALYWTADSRTDSERAIGLRVHGTL